MLKHFLYLDLYYWNVKVKSTHINGSFITALFKNKTAEKERCERLKSTYVAIVSVNDTEKVFPLRSLNDITRHDGKL